MPTVQVPKKQLDAVLRMLAAQGITPPTKGKHGNKGVQLAPDSFTAPADGSPGPVSFVVGVKTVSESNTRGWHAKSGRTGETRKAVCRMMGRHLRYLVPFAEAFHAGRTLRVTLRRLGGKKLDALANLGSALKAAEDAVALVLGADDGAYNWKATAEQKPGGPMGILIILSLDPAPKASGPAPAIAMGGSKTV